jgi:hypothetical protein
MTIFKVFVGSLTPSPLTLFIFSYFKTTKKRLFPHWPSAIRSIMIIVYKNIIGLFSFFSFFFSCVGFGRNKDSCIFEVVPTTITINLFVLHFVFFGNRINAAHQYRSSGPMAYESIKRISKEVGFEFEFCFRHLFLNLIKYFTC